MSELRLTQCPNLGIASASAHKPVMNSVKVQSLNLTMVGGMTLQALKFSLQKVSGVAKLGAKQDI